MLAIERAIQRNDWERVVRPALVERMLWRQGGRHDDSIHLTLEQMLNAAHLVVGLVFRAGNQQLIAALARPTFKIVGDTGIAGVFQVRDHQTNRAGTPGTQTGCDSIRMVVMLTNHRHNFFNGLVADTVLLCFTVNHIAGRCS